MTWRIVTPVERAPYITGCRDTHVLAENGRGEQAYVSNERLTESGLPALPDINREGERIAAETWRHPSGMYLWTDLVGAIQTAIHEERQRHAR